MFVIFFRCFPTCKPSGHTTSGFCGNSLDVSLYIEINENSPSCHLFDSFWNDDVLFLAELKCSSESSQERSISKSEMSSLLRTKEAKCNPYIKGSIISIETTLTDAMKQLKKIDLTFNQDHKAWHYGWISHKCSSERSHVVEVIVLVENGLIPDYYFLAASFRSPDFVIMSTKSGRQKKEQAPNCQTIQNNNENLKDMS